MFQTVPLSIIRSSSLYTQQWYVSYRFAVCTVKNCWWCTEEPSETWSFIPKINLKKLVHLVGFIIRIYHDARTPECQMSQTVQYAMCKTTLSIKRLLQNLISLLTSITKLNFWTNWILWSIIHFKFHLFSKMYGVKRKKKLKPL